MYADFVACNGAHVVSYFSGFACAANSCVSFSHLDESRAWEAAAWVAFDSASTAAFLATVGEPLFPSAEPILSTNEAVHLEIKSSGPGVDITF